MSDRHPTKERMIEALYGELDAAAKERHDLHLGSCPACASEQAALAETLRMMDKRERPDPGPEFWAGYWDRLSRRMVWEAAGEDRAPSLLERLARPFARLPRWALQAAGAAALLLVGVLVGGRLMPPAGNGGPVTSAVPALSPAVVDAENFVERSKVLLLGLVNHEPATEDLYALDLDRQKTVSRTLAAEAPALRDALDKSDDRRLRALVADLEVILMQIANLEAGQDLEGVELIKQGVDSKSIFLKIDLARMGRDARGPASPSARTPLSKKSKA
jgi:hypothetical protein